MTIGKVHMEAALITVIINPFDAHKTMFYSYIMFSISSRW